MRNGIRIETDESCYDVVRTVCSEETEVVNNEVRDHESSLLITFVPLIWKGWKAVYKSQMLYLSLHKCVDNIEEWTRAFFLFARRRSKSSGSLAILAVTAAAPSFV